MRIPMWELHKMPDRRGAMMGRNAYPLEPSTIRILNQFKFFKNRSKKEVINEAVQVYYILLKVGIDVMEAMEGLNVDDLATLDGLDLEGLEAVLSSIFPQTT